MKSKIFLSLFFCSVFFSEASAQAPAWEWAKQIAGADADLWGIISLDDFGNIYSTGCIEGICDFNPDSLVNFDLTSVGDRDIYISKYDASGNFIWAKSMGSSGQDQGQAVAIDIYGNSYTIGTFEDTVDFNPGVDTFNLVASIWSKNIFICKLNSVGNFVWAKQFEGIGNFDGSFSISVDSLSNVYATGWFVGTKDFDPGINTFDLTSQGNDDIFISKLDSAGNFVWAKSIGGTEDDWSFKLSIDDSGNIITTGYFSDIVDFNPDSLLNFDMTSVGGKDIFILKLDNSGNFIWAKRMGGLDDDSGWSVTTDKNGNVLTTGYFISNSVDFNPGPGTFYLNSNGDYEIFISKLNSSGNFLWAKAMGSVASDGGNSIVVDTFGNIYTSGWFEGTVDFNLGLSVFNLTSSARDIFLCKLTSSGNFLWAKSVGGANSDAGIIKINKSNNICLGGYFDSPTLIIGNDTLINVTGNGNSADMFFTKLSSCTTLDTITANACHQYISPSGNYSWSQSGIYSDTIPNFTGCDSVITINLTIINSTSSSDSVEECFSYTSPSSNYTWTTSGIYSDTIPNAAGCDSIITINLTINSVDTSVTQTANTLTSTVTSATYQWLNCDTGFAAINGATNQSFTATTNGNYAVAITQNGCTDTSSCYAVTGVGISKSAVDSWQLTVFPNPAESELTVSLVNGEWSMVNSISIADVTGREIYFQTTRNSKHETRNQTINLESYSSGIYFLKVQMQNGEAAVRKFVKE